MIPARLRFGRRAARVVVMNASTSPNRLHDVRLSFHLLVYEFRRKWR
jgi:hypothetical protein